MLALWVRFQNLLRRQEGQALSEYGMILALVLVASIAAIIAFREQIKTVFSDLTEAMKKK